MTRVLTVVLVLSASVAAADEGMWTFNNFPASRVKARYGFEPTQQWLDHVRLSSARLAGGCSASFVSENGLVMTNHHCARGCIDELSTRSRDYIKNGFYAKTLKAEARCPAVEVNQLLEIKDATDQMRKATAGLEGAKFDAAERASKAKLEKECSTQENIRCDLVRLYQGGQYQLYKYKRFQDVRLVFAPEHRIAFFGGDPDNFEFPRYDLDVSFFRVYENGQPAKMDNFFKWSDNGAKDGELTFVSGNPGRTSRLDTIAKLEYARDYALPERLFYLSEYRGMINEFQKRGAEATRISNNIKFGVENSTKALKGRRAALVDAQFFAKLRAQEKALRDKVMADPKMKQEYGQAWDRIAQAVEQLKDIRTRLMILESAAGAGSDLFGIARTLLRSGQELPRPNAERLPEFAEARLNFLKLNLFSPAPIYPELETAQLSFYLVKLRELLGADDPVVKQVLGNNSVDELAARVVKGTKLRDPKVRQRLWNGGAKAIDAAKDPMIELARSLDGAAREVRKRYEENIESAMKKNEELIARARFQIYGTSTYPDATFSPRVSYGSVQGYMEEGKKVEPFTYMGGTFDHATGKEPFDLPPSWLKARSRIDPKVPMNFVTSNDIIGGNSGSPVVNKNAEIVGLVFDGNIQSLGGEYGFDPSNNRTVAVHSSALIEALDKVYGATRLLQELKPAAKPAGQTGAH